MSFKRFLNSHFVFGNEKHISFFQGSSFRFAVIKVGKQYYREQIFPKWVKLIERTII